MIVEVNSMSHFDRLASQWNSPAKKNFWTSLSNKKTYAFDSDSIERNLRSLLLETIHKGDILPYLKMFSYEKNGISLAMSVFLARENFLINKTIFEEVLWQMPGRYPKSIQDRKIMIELLRYAEKYARNNKINILSICRDPELHNFTREANTGINNYYTRNNFDATGIQYFKTLN